MKNHNVRVALFVLMFVGMFLLVAFNYSNPNDKAFSSEAFYQGKQGDLIDYKDLYNDLYVGLAPGSGECANEMTAAKGYTLANGEVVQDCMAGRFQWITPRSIKSSSEIGSDSIISPYQDGDVIISPGNLKFINSNVLQDSKDTIYIEAVLANKYVVRWDNVTSWWCHIGKENKNKHSRVVGKNGIYSSCSAGYIIGEANANTTVSFFILDEDGNQTPIGASEVFGDFSY